MSDQIVLDKGKLRAVGLFVLVVALAMGTVLFVKRKLLKSGPFEIASIERADAEHPADRDVVVLRDGTKLTDIGYQLKSIGVLEKDQDHGALILSGMECQDCAALESLLVHVLPQSQTIQIQYPGQVYDPPTGDRAEGDLSLESRVFYGECLEEIGPSILIHKNTREADGAYKQTLSVMGFTADGDLQEVSRESAPFQIAELLKSAERHCREIPGKVFKH